MPRRAFCVCGVSACDLIVAQQAEQSGGPFDLVYASTSAQLLQFRLHTVGHVTVDVIAAEHSRRPGGGAFYSALQAARLGLRTLILTQGAPPEIEALLEPYRDELGLHILPAPATTTFETSWPGGQRHQRVLAWAGPIAGPIEVDTRILHFAPVARETLGRVARARRLRRAHTPGARAHVGPPPRRGTRRRRA